MPSFYRIPAEKPYSPRPAKNNRPPQTLFRAAKDAGRHETELPKGDANFAPNECGQSETISLSLHELKK